MPQKTPVDGPAIKVEGGDYYTARFAYGARVGYDLESGPERPWQVLFDVIICTERLEESEVIHNVVYRRHANESQALNDCERLRKWIEECRQALPTHATEPDPSQAWAVLYANLEINDGNIVAYFTDKSDADWVVAYLQRGLNPDHHRYTTGSITIHQPGHNALRIPAVQQHRASTEHHRKP